MYTVGAYSTFPHLLYADAPPSSKKLTILQFQWSSRISLCLHATSPPHQIARRLNTIPSRPPKHIPSSPPRPTARIHKPPLPTRKRNLQSRISLATDPSGQQRRRKPLPLPDQVPPRIQPRCLPKDSLPQPPSLTPPSCRYSHGLGLDGPNRRPALLA